jgi:hypothetical protein
MLIESAAAFSATELHAQAEGGGWGEGYTLAYSKTDAGVTTAVHWVTALMCLVIAVLLSREEPSAWSPADVPPALYGLATIQLLAAVVASYCSWRAVRLRHTYYNTDRWDNITATLQVLAAVAGTFWLNGTASPTWLVVGPILVYCATLMVQKTGLILITVVTLSAIGSAAVNDGWTVHALPVTLAVIVGIPATFLVIYKIAAHMYGDSESNMWSREVLTARVRDLSDPLERAAGGDLTIAGALLAIVEAGNQGDDDPLLALTGSFDHTLESLGGFLFFFFGAANCFHDDPLLAFFAFFQNCLVWWGVLVLGGGGGGAADWCCCFSGVGCCSGAGCGGV